MKKKVKPEGKEEYWGQEYKCPYCNYLGMHGAVKYCCNCGKSFRMIEFIYED